MSKNILQTKRFNLRTYNVEDIDLLLKLDSDPEVTAFFPKGPLNRQQINEKITKNIKLFNERGFSDFIIESKDGEEFIGRAGFSPVDTEIEVGYLLLKKYWGQGIATEVLIALLNWAEENVKADYIIAFAPVEHSASLRVMQKVGMEFYKEDMAHGVICKFYKYQFLQP